MVGQNAVPNFDPQQLRRQREEKGLSRYELETAAGLPPGTLGQYEQGHRAPYVDRLAAIARALGVSPDALRTIDTGDEPPSLAELRIAAGETQQEVASRAGLTRSRYSAIERGEVERVPAQVVARIAAALSVSADAVRTGHAVARRSYLDEV